MSDLQGKTVFITGASRGIGRAIALRCASDGANVVITGKTAAAHPKLPGTIHSVVEEVEKAGGKGLAIQLDVRDKQALQTAVELAALHFGGIDVLVNNASAIYLTNTVDTSARRLDMMWSVNMRATFLALTAVSYQYLISRIRNNLRLTRGAQYLRRKIKLNRRCGYGGARPQAIDCNTLIGKLSRHT